ncbi:cytochrome oxidase small assembly protein [Verticiella sediminum]|nr:cytochrome oxidase small assembly protein [Verticiella sediminum]
MQNEEQRRRNRRTGLILASVALVFLLGYVVRRMMLGA